MDEGTFLRMLCEEARGLQCEAIPQELWNRIIAEESTVKACGGNMPMEDMGLAEMSRRGRRFYLHGGMIHLPEFSTISMVDDGGNEVGRHLKPSEIPEYEGREDVVFLSYDFVMFTDVRPVGETRVIMMPVPYRGLGDWVPEECHATLWFPSTTTDMLLHEWFGRGGAGSVILGFDAE